MSTIAFLAVLAGLIRPQWVQRRRAFGLAIILLVTLQVVGIFSVTLGQQGLTKWWYDFGEAMREGHQEQLGSFPWLWIALSMLAPLLNCALIVSTIKAFWPGGGLFSLRSGQDGPADVVQSEQTEVALVEPPLSG